MAFFMEEKHSTAYSVRWGIKDIIYTEKTPYQKLYIIETEEFGRALVLDNILQTTINDEFYYHEMIAHVPLFTHANPRRVLIIGGGDGGTAREVLKHKSVEQIDLIDIDERVIDVCKKFLPELSCSFDNPKVNVIISDGVKYVQNQINKYDIAIIDSTDLEPVGLAAGLYSSNFYQDVYRCLKDDGLFVAHTESPSFSFSQHIFRELWNRINAYFPLTKTYITCVPSYISGYWSFTIGSKLYHPISDYRQDNTVKTRFYTSELHRSCFVLPRFMHELIAEKRSSNCQEAGDYDGCGEKLKNNKGGNKLRTIAELGRPAIMTLDPYVPGKPIEEVEREFGITGVIKLASNENPLGPSPSVIEALKAAAPRVFNYPDSICYYLKKEMASLYSLSEDNFLLGNGTDEIIKMIGETFLNSGDEVIYPWPTFSEYVFAGKLMGATLSSVPLTKHFKHDLIKMAEHAGKQTKLIIICNPNNPTGTIVDRDEMQWFFKAIPSDILVVVDEAYYEYVNNPCYSSAVEMIKDKHVIVLRTFSKIYGLAGLRLGYAIASPEIISMINRVREPFNVNMMAQEAAVVALRDQAHVSQSKEMVINGKGYLYQEFERLGLEYVPSETNFIFVDLQRDSREIFAALLKDGMIIRTGDIFDYPNYIRVTVGTPEQNKHFITCLEKVLAELTPTVERG